MNEVSKESRGKAPFSDSVSRHGKGMGRQAIQTEKVNPPDSDTLHLMDTSFPLIDIDGSAYNTGHTVHDVVDKRLAGHARNTVNAQQRESDPQKEKFLATLAHELRNPLAPIRTAVEVIRLRKPADEVVQRARTVIERQVLHLTRMVDGMLDISRSSPGTAHLQHETLDLRAVAKNQGSRFRIELPADSASESVPAPTAQTPAPGDTGARLLVVEDNHDAADLLAEMMDMMGFRVSVAYTGESALAAMEKEMPDAVLMDIGLPDINGYEVCRRLRQLTASRQPVAIALTGWGNDNDRDRASEAGFNAHLTKPAEPDRIVALLHELLEAAAGHALT